MHIFHRILRAFDKIQHGGTPVVACMQRAVVGGGLELACKIATSAALSNYAIVSSINRIADMASTEGLFTEGLMAAVVQTGQDVQERLGEFVSKKAAKVKPNRTQAPTSVL